MKTNKIVGVILGLAVLCGIGLGGSAYGQLRRNRNWDGYPNWGGSYDLRQTALNAGYNEGTKEGNNDRGRRRRSSYSDFSSYQKATKDYSSRLGDRGLYQRYFRLAFERGYETAFGTQLREDDNRDRDRNDNRDRDRNDNRDRDRNDNRGSRGRNWDRYGNYGGSYELRQTALNAGYNEGIKAGRNDRRNGRFNPQGSGAYRSATKDYNSRYGDRYAYQTYFRQAFINGYSDGYNYGY